MSSIYGLLFHGAQPAEYDMAVSNRRFPPRRASPHTAHSPGGLSLIRAVPRDFTAATRALGFKIAHVILTVKPITEPASAKWFYK